MEIDTVEKTDTNTETPAIEKVDLEQLREDLKDNGVTFGNRTGPAKLIALAVDNDVEIPLLEAEDEGEDDEPQGGNVVPEKYRQKYGKAQNCGDEMALALKEYVTVVGKNEKGKEVELCDIDLLAEVALSNGLSLDPWDHLNIGMKRMNLGNVLRGRLNKGQRVQVGAQVWEAKEPEAKDAEVETKASKM
jgi:hypothetical protein